MRDVKSLLKSFVYALKGVRWALCHERNFRIHGVCMFYMFYYLVLHDFFVLSRAEIAILALACAMVLGGELINTGIEKADDTVTAERRRTIEISKNAAAGAVLVFAVVAVFVGIVILWQPEAFKLLFEFYMASPIRIVFLVLSLSFSLLFIFKVKLFVKVYDTIYDTIKGKNKGKNNGK